ncbi:helix-turn-helix transcriptional regulator [Streptomyces sp. CBMA152]|uniref:helix-turn-helix transcriptional regulator n=1 Tax=Streptomyces sp. CBMA152 TaxID=1896312 RepID=UPI001661220B|nr:helix-turn-helix transcriptional regulator [Streptomyces sp. CBMA152]MBD0743528.1 hypothetical protein [Streptomyces sp. CBMA152]
MTGAGRQRVERLISKRPLQALELFSQGATRPEIATALTVTRSTVDVYLSHATRALGGRNLVHAIVLARRRGLFDPGGVAIALLTARQRAALVCAANGETNDEIAISMGLAASSVNSLLKGAYRVLGVGDRAQAVAVAMRLRIITAEDVSLPEALAGSAGGDR